jgi:hypothetical protein
VPRPRFELGTPAFSVRCSTKLSYLGTADDCIDRELAGVRGILLRMKQAQGWLWMGGAIAALIAVQAFRHSEPLASVDAFLNGARGLVPLGIAITIIGAGLLLGAWIHGMLLDARRVQPVNISGSYTGPSPRGGWRKNYFWGRLLWGAELHEESGVGELKRSWLTGEWLRDHRLLRLTMVLVGLPLLVVGVFGTVALVTDVTAVRMLLVLTTAYVAVRLSYSLIRA